MKQKKCIKIVWALKERLKWHKANSIDNGPAKIIKTDYIQGLLKTPELGNNIFQKMVETRLLKKP